MSQITSPIPVNVITGFLGVGKTSSILKLIEQKPADEEWAILVNEFGEIGVDRGLVQGQLAPRNDVMVFEVPGGCMCCAAGLPMEMALSQIFFLGEPDRLIIEPTGLGHPAEVLGVLAAESYADQLELHTTIALVDPRTVADKQRCHHPSFIQQIEIADLVVANKADLASSQDLLRLRAFLDAHGATNVAMQPVEYGAVDIAFLDGRSAWSLQQKKHHHTEPNYIPAADSPLPDCGFLRADNRGEGFESVGWRFSAEMIFNRAKVVAFLQSVHAERIKAVLITEAGIFGYNISRSEFSELPIDDCMESRLEIIALESDLHWERALMKCLTAP
jgi:G3E family GTPase